MEIFLNNLRQHNQLFKNLGQLESSINCVTKVIVASLHDSNKLMICGNGGSAADSQHIAAEFTGLLSKISR